MRIAFFTDTYHPSKNGVVTSTDTFRRELEHLGHEVRVFAPDAPGAEELPGVTRVASVPLPTEPNCRVAFPFPPALLKRFAQPRFDVIHTQTPFGLGIWGAALARMFHTPLVHTYHTFFAEYSHYLKMRRNVGRAFAARYSRVYCNRCQAVVVPSEAFIDVLRSYKVTAPIEVIPTGVSVTDSRPSREAARRLLGLPLDRPILLYVGRLAREKNIEFLLQALERLVREDVAALLVLVGDGPHRESLAERARSLRLEDSVLWTGGVPHARVFEYYAAADLFAFASKTETQGLVVAEALASGLPAVAVKGPGVIDYVSPGNGGFLAEDSLEAFLRPVRALLHDPEMRAEASALGRRAGRLWSSSRQAERLAELYESLLPEARKPRLLRRALASVSAGIAAGDRLYRRRL